MRVGDLADELARLILGFEENGPGIEYFRLQVQDLSQADSDPKGMYFGKIDETRQEGAKGETVLEDLDAHQEVEVWSVPIKVSSVI